MTESQKSPPPPREKTILWFISGMLMAAVTTGLYQASTSYRTNPSVTELSSVSDEVAKISSKELSKPLRLNAITKNVDFVVINFWASWCSACLSETPVLNELKQHIVSNKKEKSFKIIGIAVQDDPLNAKSSLKAKKAKYDLYYDIGKSMEETFEVDSLPQTLVYSKKSGFLFRVNSKLKPAHITKLKNLVGYKNASN